MCAIDFCLMLTCTRTPKTHKIIYDLEFFVVSKKITFSQLHSFDASLEWMACIQHQDDNGTIEEGNDAQFRNAVDKQSKYLAKRFFYTIKAVRIPLFRRQQQECNDRGRIKSNDLHCWIVHFNVIDVAIACAFDGAAAFVMDFQCVEAISIPALTKPLQLSIWLQCRNFFLCKSVIRVFVTFPAY